MIKDKFIQNKSNKAGIYTIKMYLRGKPTLITIDDTLFFKQDTILSSAKPYPAYARIDPTNLTIWGPLLEKAWAKINGNFE